MADDREAKSDRHKCMIVSGQRDLGKQISEKARNIIGKQNTRKSDRSVGRETEKEASNQEGREGWRLRGAGRKEKGEGDEEGES